jgi:hypothetical protein
MIQAWDRLKAFIKPEIIGWLLVVLGGIMRLRQYFDNRSLWGDESSLAVNIVERSFTGLTQQLGYHQAAPLGFLFIEKISIVLLWNADYILRLFPLLSGLISVYLMYRIAKDHFGRAGMFALLMFSINTFLIFYSSELKQYSSDVMISLLLFHFATQCFKEGAGNRDFLFLGIVGMAAIWISHTSVFILAAIGLTLAFETVLLRRKDLPRIFALGAAWLASFGLEYLIALQYTAADKYFQTFWARRFAPLPPWRMDDAWWYIKTGYFFLFTIVTRSDLLTTYIVCGLLAIGVVSLFIKNWKLALSLILAFVVTLIASALKKYPLTYRFMLFLTPLALLFMAEGLGRIYSIIAKWQRGLALVFFALPAVFLIWLSTVNAVFIFNYPQTNSEIKPVIKYLAEHKQPDDIVYVYYGATPGFIYYAPFYNFGNLNSKNIILGAYRQNEIKGFERFFEDMEALKGNDRVWFVFSEITECGGCEGDKQLYFENYLNGYGVMLDSVKDISSAAYLYDLKP